MKTVRFAQLVERFGRPHVHAFWVAPKDDHEFQRARKADRVMTVEPTRRDKADTGLVGFDEANEQGSQILIFPKSLKALSGARVIGIKFDLVDQPLILEAGARHNWTPPKKKKPAPKPTAAPTGDVPAPVNRLAAKTPDVAAPASEAEDLPAPSSPPPSRHRARPPGQAKRSPTRVPGERVSKTPSKAKAAGEPLAAKVAAEIRAALEELRDGKTVAAYQRLQKLLGNSS